MTATISTQMWLLMDDQEGDNPHLIIDGGKYENVEDEQRRPDGNCDAQGSRVGRKTSLKFIYFMLINKIRRDSKSLQLKSLLCRDFNLVCKDFNCGNGNNIEQNISYYQTIHDYIILSLNHSHNLDMPPDKE